jgi:Flp pilus assembly protein TadG
MMVRDLLKSMRRDQQGTTAVEFAIVAPVFIALLLGTLALCVALFLIGSLHFAVEDGARCASVKTTICSDGPTTVAYTQSHYFGPSLSPNPFTYTPATPTNNCNRVTASISYSMNVGFRTYTIPISATACFP